MSNPNPLVPELKTADGSVISHQDLIQDVIESAYRSDLDNSNLLNLAIQCMEVASKLSSMSGAEKKQWVIMVLKQIIQSHPRIDPDTKRTLILAVDQFVSSAIDHLVSASQGVYTFVQTLDSTHKCSWWCCQSQPKSSSSLPKVKRV